MTFLIGDHLYEVGDLNLPYEMYRSYIKQNEKRFPSSVIALINNPDWSSGGSDSNTPYYSDLKTLEIQNVSTADCTLTLNLWKEGYVPEAFGIEIRYSGVLEIEIPNQKYMSVNPLVWRYEQFLYFDPWERYEHNEKMFTHQIEWVGGTVWSITAAGIEVTWKKS